MVKVRVEATSMLVGRGKRRPLHFRDLSHDDKLGALEHLKGAPWTGVIVASDTTTTSLVNTHLSLPRWHYHYALRYVLERVSSYGKEIGEQATIFIEERRNFDLAEFRQYVQKLPDNGVHRIDPSCVSPSRIFQLAKGIDDTACIADSLANAAYRALEPHRTWGHCEQAYFNTIQDRLWRGPTGQENIHVWGFVLMPTSLWGTKFVAEYPWILDLH